MSLANVVKRLRLKSSLSQEELAKRAGVSRSYISKIELGNAVDISAPTLINIAKALKVNESLLMEEAGFNPSVMPSLPELASADRFIHVPDILLNSDDIRSIKDFVGYLEFKKTQAQEEEEDNRLDVAEAESDKISKARRPGRQIG
jgi:transcriptional regulator with XRE-family HTH domain